ncbi:hypothetical protein [Nocardioides sp. T2.26MG-1]|uniref:hypothetical protein n=1 Tax=Nocardioides sp. T2.26MG-1 TaxID=3041166 RepID=UPI0024773DB3|nr:hypothetical protein [Nocardioides sp. T2.26MG-1]CAI9417245.1 hypothetical protein HIDPHFAB_02972 [Nocardioides sp. T2.26MG-1]
MVTGTPLAYVAGTSHRPIPMATDSGVRRTTHTEPTPKPTGLDWDAITPTCTSCSQRSGQLGPGGLCPTCRGVQPTTGKKTRKQGYAAAQLPEDELLRRFTGPDDTPLGHLEVDPEPTHEEEPAGHPARAELEDEVQHVQRAAQLPTYSPEANLAAQIEHAARVLRDTADAQHPATRLLRLNAIAALEALHLFHQLNHTYAPAPTHPTPTPVGAGQTSPEPLSASQGLGGGRPAARTEGEAVARPATHRRVDADRIVALYTAGKYMNEIQSETGNAVSTIKRVLIDAGVQIRPRGPKPGDKHKNYDPTLIADVRRLYTDEHLNQAEVANHLGIGIKVVQNVMRAAHIPTRATAVERSQAGTSHRTNTLGRLRDAINATGATPRQIKDWALSQGLIPAIARGLPHLGLVEAYAAAHPTDLQHNTTSTGDTQ